MKEMDVKREMVITKGCYEERNIQRCLLDLIPATAFLNSLKDQCTMSPCRSSSADLNNRRDVGYPLTYFYPSLSCISQRTSSRSPISISTRDTSSLSVSSSVKPALEKRIYLSSLLPTLHLTFPALSFNLSNISVPTL